jgi:hypothetical protein
VKTLKILALTAIISTLSIAQKEALLIGVGDYQGKKNDLKGIEIDVSNMKSLFEKWGFHTTVLLDSDSMKIDEYLTNYHSLGADDSFAFYYSGHGSHTDDSSGDETDGQDETLVLSNGVENRFYLDDNLNRHFNSIGAKKLIIFDSCHSGTAFKAFGDKPKPKSISSKLSGTEIKSKSFRHRVSEELDGGEYIVFSASQDSEESLATRDGSLFTNAFVKEFKSGGEFKKLANIKQSIEQDIYRYCTKQTDSVVHHPNLSASKDKLRYTTINKFFATKATPPPPQKTITISGKTTFREGELLSFKVDTNGNSGYLTIFSMENGEPFIMTQTPQPVSGILNFQQDFSINPPIECYKSCGSCKQEVSSVYIILSEKPLTKEIMKSKGLNIDGDSKPVGMRAFRHKTDESFEPIIARVEFTII